MSDTTARDEIARALYDLARAQEPEQVSDYYPESDAVLARLDAAGWSITGKPEDRWGFYVNEYPSHIYERYGEDSAIRGIEVNPDGRTLVRWIHGGPGWEVVPDVE